ncbi:MULTISPECIES: 2-succinyl-5-enolpyruvyl-6-hydroxy-3-cyclohexene-1-carboxylic-acid synthase [Brevibacterium]|uniref:2-succinyl-5-enolpyruvyl-6-hydroxy-3- cyclohexene-1-carboxylic-acid synthase n=1 Tax=Brevibacterium TaxID=1696 RepID=UPI00201269AA|nr:2-succinyl-5-enolpyruvyl-6-hydroxy-3-cyclohexene-1-carboxylic-acid synthase [Brevibacterium sp. W7.2]
MSNSSAVAQQIARSLVAAGVREVVLAPGSRSAPLVYALAPLAEAGVIRTHVRLDERDAGFLALGLARGLRVRGAQTGEVASAVALVTTSGSAVANLHPAVLEAAYGHLPLIALTADRPARLRGTGANQTIDDQAQVLSDVRARIDVPAGEDTDVVGRMVTGAVRTAVGPVGGTGTEAAGPVQVNVQFDTPLVPTSDELRAWTDEIAGWDGAGTDAAGTTAAAQTEAPSFEVTVTEGTVIVAGDAGGHSADLLRALAADRHLPVLAEPSSPLTRPMAGVATFVPAHARVLSERTDLRDAIRTVIVHGKPTLTRPVAALLADNSVSVQRVPDDIDATVLTVSDDKRADNTGADDKRADDKRADETAWLRDWIEAGEAFVSSAAESPSAAQTNPPSTPQASPQSTARAITEHLAAEDITLFVASSNSVRYLSDATDLPARIHASRGLAGIDGLVSTATGLSLGLEERVVLLIGDIALLHDVGGLLTPAHEQAGDVVIVVLNDDGGAIFSGLEHSQDHIIDRLERYFTVPHGRRFADLAAAYGWDHEQVSTLEDFSAVFADVQACSQSAGGPGTRRTIIEVDLTSPPTDHDA